jgi:SPP1 family predicted phage head-tail adaptor
MENLMKTPDISELRHRITFQNLNRVSDGQGGYVETWSNFYECWAKINPKSGNERNSAQRIEDFYDHEITIRWPEVNLLAEMQITFEGRVFQIKSLIKPDMRRWYCVIKCEEKAGS